LNDKYVKLACKQIPDRMVLVNVCSRRAKELARGAHPMVPVDRSKAISHLDIALQEVAEGKVDFEATEAESKG
jgi:DNA-directed RNA polymerase omega subunit